MATIQSGPSPQTKPAASKRLTRGFDYVTLDPSPRLRKMREKQEKAAKDPTEVIRAAWMCVGAAIRDALQITQAENSSPNR